MYFIRFVIKFALLPAIGGTLVSLGLVEVLGSVKLAIGAGILASWVAYASGYRAASGNPLSVIGRTIREIYAYVDYSVWSRLTEQGRKAVADIREDFDDLGEDDV